MQDMEHLQEIWPNWKIEEKIGEGAYGKVYKIRREGIGYISFAALKIIEFPQSQAEIRELLNSGMDYQSIREYYGDLKKNLINEIQIMESLKTGSNIVAIEDYSFRDHEKDVGCTIYIRMELLESLNDILQKEKELSVEEVIKLGCDVCKALECCEDAKIIHRDIKPDNVFRNRYGDYKLGDFGISKQIMETRSAVAETKTGTSMYMAPEVYRGERYDRTVDIYSLGIMLYRLLNYGRFPFMPPVAQRIRPADTEDAMRRRMNGERMAAPARADGKLALTIAKAVAYAPKQRYQHASEFREELAGCLQNANINQEPEAYEEQPKERVDTEPSNYKTEKTYNAWEEKHTENTVVKEPVVENNTQKENRQEPEKLNSIKKEEGIVFHWPENTDKKPPQDGKQHKLARMIMGGIIALIIIVFAFSSWKNAKHEKEEQAKDRAILIAQEYLLDKEYDLAIENYKVVVSHYPDDKEGYLGLADAYVGLGKYEEALQILEEGNEKAVLTNEIEAKYEEVSRLNDYYKKIESAKVSLEGGETEQAETEYKEAIEIDENLVDAYTGLSDLYISQGKYDDAINWLETVTAISTDEISEMTDKCRLSKVNKMMADSDYNGLLQFFKNDRNNISDGNIYLQDGNKVDSIESGSGMILSNYGVYVGEIIDSQRSGSGKQFGTYSNSDSAYEVTEGQWSGDKANGQCTYIREDPANIQWGETIVGNVTDNLWNGDLTYTWTSSDGVTDSYAVHAEAGTYSCIRIEDGNYVFGESESGRYIFYPTEEDLKNRGV